MLIFPKKPKFVKTFSGKKLLPKTTNKNAKIRFGYYCLIAKESGFLTNFQMEAIRKLLRRSLRKRGQIFFKLFPSIPITKKPSETRLGRGKGKFKYWTCLVQRGDILLEIRSANKQFVTQFFNTLSFKFPIKTFFFKRYDRWIL